MKRIASSRYRPTVFSLLALSLLAGCDEKKGMPAAPIEAAPSAVPDSAPVAAPKDNPHSERATPGHGQPRTKKPEVAIAWDVPSGWKEIQTRSMMRHATYSAPGDAGPAEVAVFYFGPGQGGDIEANISRWVKQFQDTAPDAVSRDVREAGGLKQFVVSVTRGTFSSGMPGGPQGPQEKWGLEGAIVEAPSGRYFFKMTGPGETVDKNRAAFGQLLASTRVKD